LAIRFDGKVVMCLVNLPKILFFFFLKKNNNFEKLKENKIKIIFFFLKKRKEKAAKRTNPRGMDWPPKTKETSCRGSLATLRGVRVAGVALHLFYLFIY
jgi:hypothetical protein